MFNIPVPVDSVKNILLLNPLRTTSLVLRKLRKLFITIFFSCFLPYFFGFVSLINLLILSAKSDWSSSASSKVIFPLYISSPKVLIVLNFLKSYLYSPASWNNFSLCTFFSIFLILLISSWASSLANALFGIIFSFLISKFLLSSDFNVLKASTCFFPWSLIVSI